jgi:AcrR family transcriptional regulator
LTDSRIRAILLFVLDLPMRDRKAERRAATRAEIVQAAWQVAEEQGIQGLTLREVALYVGMKPPSLYSHFESKNAIYDAMFEQAWADYAAAFDELALQLPVDPRSALLAMAQLYFDFAAESVPRHLLMSQRVIPGFEPSEHAYRPAVAVLERFSSILQRIGIDDSSHVDLATAVIGGLVGQQLANDPEGSRWRELLPQAIAIYADAVLPADHDRRDPRDA